jgi:S-adenosylmethionine synthetase
MAKNLVASGVADELMVQISYAIGVVEPTSIYIDTFGTSHVKLNDYEIAEKAGKIFDMRPFAIEERLKLRNPIYLETAAYGHMGKTPRIVKKVFESPYNGKVEKEVELFTWEKLDMIDEVKKVFQL